MHYAEWETVQEAELVRGLMLKINRPFRVGRPVHAPTARRTPRLNPEPPRSTSRSRPPNLMVSVSSFHSFSISLDGVRLFKSLGNTRDSLIHMVVSLQRP